MKIVLADTPDTQVPDHTREKEILTKGVKDSYVVVHDYDPENREAFFKEIEDADAILTAYIEMDKEAIERAKKLKIISVSATGFNNIDLDAASARGIGVSPIGEYCSKDVAEFTIGVIFALAKNLKQHFYNIEKEAKWEYDHAIPNQRVEKMTLGIVGFGKIGKVVAQKAAALGMNVLAVDKVVDQETDFGPNIQMTDLATLLQESDVISNHMNLNETNHDYFDYETFSKCENSPFFINTGRAACVVETDLIKALDEGIIKGAALDVLDHETEDLDLKHHPLVHRDNVIVTPHMAFYTTDAMSELIRISCENIVHFLNGEPEKVFKLVNGDRINK